MCYRTLFFHTLLGSEGRALDSGCSNAQLDAGVGATEAECSDNPGSFRSLCPWVAHRKIGAKLASAVCLENREARAEGGLACPHYIGDSCKDTSCIAGQWGSYPFSIHVK